MSTPTQDAIRRCHDATASGSMDFPQIVAVLAAAGVEGYMVDFRRATQTYYLPDGGSVELPARPVAPPAAAFDEAAIAAAVREAQEKVAGYSYAGFCAKVSAAGCAGYMVSFSGRRAVYFGRTAQTHVEHFPQAA
ncbi:DUF1398 domain-containing protein [Ancylobacter sp. G4_0304]|uniref:DUF1398 domain-containing protein n=1 Tax=Ancylobacter sp. G4_0304 TaxID=3114289 RepID=UPI0039C66686